MMKKYLIRYVFLYIVLLIPILGNAQTEDNIWVFGGNGALDFNTGTPVPLTGYIMASLEGSASISDNLGNILFYSGGTSILNSAHSIMPNGAGLLGLTASSSQGAVISKYPGSDNLYYLFTVEETGAFPGHLRYNIVDMTLDGGLGDVVVGSKNIIIDTFVHEKLTVTMDDACNYWLMTYSIGSQEYHAFRITPDGIEPKVVSTSPFSNNVVGQLKISPNGQFLASPDFSLNRVEIAQFDRATGLVSGFITVNLPAGTSSAYGCEFSANSNVLYVGHSTGIVQYDLSLWPSATAIAGSAYSVISAGLNYPQLRRASNGKIYHHTTYGGSSISVIDAPNLLGAACNPIASVVTMPAGSSVSFSLGESVVVNTNSSVTPNNVYDTLLCYADSLVLSAPSDIEYLWDDGSTMRSRTVFTGGTYWVRFGSACEKLIDTFHVLMTDSNFILENVDTIVCTGATVNLSVEDRAGYEYNWVSANSIDDINAASTTMIATHSGWVRVHVSYPGCDSFTKSFYVEVKEVPEVELGENTIICLGKSISIFPDVPGADEDYTYSWTPTAGVSDPSALDVVLSPAISTTYYLSVNSGAATCNAIDSIRVNVIPNTIELVNNDTTICNDVSLSLNVIGHPSFAYYWTPEAGVDNPLIPNTAVTPSNSGYIHIRASRDGCDDMFDSFYVDVQPVPDVNIGDDLVICGGVPQQLYGSANPPYDGYLYTWSPGTRMNDSTIQDPVYTSYATSEWITLTVQTPHGCIGRDTLYADVTPKIPMTVNTNDTGFCLPGQVPLEAFNADNYVWTPALGLSDDSISNPIASPDYSTTYMVVGNTSGCLDTQYVNVAVYPSVIIHMPDSAIIYPGESYEIDLNSNAHYYSWFPPEGLSNTAIGNPVASPFVRTRYYVTASTEYGCTLTDSIDIVVNTGYVFDIPNAFAPGNGYSANGTFKIIKRGDVTLNKFQIFNRWGQKVFETSDVNEGWNGKLDGTTQPMGVYVYMIEATLKNGQQIQLNGNVTLVK